MSALHAPFSIRSKLPATGTSIFSVMSALAQTHGAVNLGQGFPDYAIDPQLIGLVTAGSRVSVSASPPVVTEIVALCEPQANATMGAKRSKRGTRRV